MLVAVDSGVDDDLGGYDDLGGDGGVGGDDIGGVCSGGVGGLVV